MSPSPERAAFERGVPAAAASRVVGLDLSLLHTAAVALPTNVAESASWADVRWTQVGYPLSRDADQWARAQRMRTIADEVLRFVRAASTSTVWLEEMAFGRGDSMAREIAGMTWLVRIALLEAGFTVRTVPASAARKVFLGHARRTAKRDVQAALRGLRAPFADSADCCDAFVVANYALTEVGARCLMFGGRGVTKYL